MSIFFQKIPGNISYTTAPLGFKCEKIVEKDKKPLTK
jgi:hypothetical protein